MRAWLLGLLVLGCSSTRAPTPQSERPGIDFAQAERMLELLRAAPSITPERVEAVMVAPGTDLIVRQQNLSRRVTAAQYRAVVAAIANEVPPALEPADDGERSKRGVTGLREDVWPALHWAIGNADLLRDRIAALRTLDAAPAARALALEWLPDGAAPEVRLHVVMGGRAGAAALDHDIYFDVLITSYRASVRGTQYPPPSETIEFFAHEAHHVGLEPIVDAARKRLVLDDNERRAFDTLVMLVTEGSATYFINAHHDLARMEHDRMYAENLGDRDELLATFEHLVAGALDGKLAGEAYEQAITPLVGSGFHSAGAVLLDAVYRSRGRAAVMDVLRDPRGLFAAYNASTRGKQLDRALADRLARMGAR